MAKPVGNTLCSKCLAPCWTTIALPNTNRIYKGYDLGPILRHEYHLCQNGIQVYEGDIEETIKDWAFRMWFFEDEVLREHGYLREGE